MHALTSAPGFQASWPMGSKTLVLALYSVQATSTLHTFIYGVNKVVSNVVIVPELSVLLPGKY